MCETQGRHRSGASGTEYTYVLRVRPYGKEIWSAHVFRDKQLVYVLARGLVERELTADDVTEQARSLVAGHIKSLR
ncbi:hypothetical protein [Piscinibacter sp.]|jgi:hypothetical protein|uniref:hypothetical protein n=1 Tax=Piscinibacter sp. TaxID=1903157 RepID=UPI00355AB6DE